MTPMPVRESGASGVARAGLCWRRLTPGVGKCKGVGERPVGASSLRVGYDFQNDTGTFNPQFPNKGQKTVSCGEDSNEHCPTYQAAAYS